MVSMFPILPEIIETDLAVRLGVTQFVTYLNTIAEKACVVKEKMK